jgi:hypothetical protein
VCPTSPPSGRHAAERRQLWPDRDATDGMYVATWTRPTAG